MEVLTARHARGSCQSLWGVDAISSSYVLVVIPAEE